MRIREVLLGDREIRKDGDEWVEVQSNVIAIPLFLTNRSLKRGKDSGLVESSALSQIAKMDFTDEEACYKILYMAAVGANPEFEKKTSYTDFVDQLLLDPNELMYKTQSVLQDTLPDKAEDWIKELEKATEKKNPKKN